MSNTKLTRTVAVAGPDGLHLRAALAVIGVARRFPNTQVVLIKEAEAVSAAEVLPILMLCAMPGDELLLEATGQQADEVLDALARLFANNFEEVPQATQ